MSDFQTLDLNLDQTKQINETGHFSTPEIKRRDMSASNCKQSIGECLVLDIWIKPEIGGVLIVQVTALDRQQNPLLHRTQFNLTIVPGWPNIIL